MIIDVHTSTFRTTWESVPSHFTTQNNTTPEKFNQIVWDIFSILIPIILLVRAITYIIRHFAAKMLLPSVKYSEKNKELARQNLVDIGLDLQASHEMLPYTIVTPDGVALRATLFRDRLGDQNTPTTIYFHGNGSLQGFGCWRWLLNRCVKNHVRTNFAVFDYRGTGESKGIYRVAKDLLLDGASILAWVRKEIKTPDPQIHFYGMSLGGAIALKTKALDKKLSGFFISERSFSNLEDLVYSHSILPWFLKPIKPVIVSCLKKEGLKLDPAADIKNLNGRMLFVYHRFDPVIPFVASIAKYAPLKDTFELREKVLVDNHHSEVLASYIEAQEKIFGFAFRH